VYTERIHNYPLFITLNQYLMNTKSMLRDKYILRCDQLYANSVSGRLDLYNKDSSEFIAENEC